MLAHTYIFYRISSPPLFVSINHHVVLHCSGQKYYKFSCELLEFGWGDREIKVHVTTNKAYYSLLHLFTRYALA